MTEPVRRIDAAVVANERLSREYYRLLLDAPQIACGAKPGQFVNLRVLDAPDPVLPRPFSLMAAGESCNLHRDHVAVLYRVAGRGTQTLSELAPGARVLAVGPLGQGFSPPPDVEFHVAVGGGTGVAPLLFLAHHLAFHTGGAPPRVALALGARTRATFPDDAFFAALPAGVHLSTDAGDPGTFRGNAVDLARGLLPEKSRAGLYGAGPPAMLRALARLAEERGLSCQVSLEARMACGLGACKSCAVAVRPRGRQKAPVYRTVCTQGPVFDAAAVDWDRYAE